MCLGFIPSLFWLQAARSCVSIPAGKRHMGGFPLIIPVVCVGRSLLSVHPCCRDLCTPDDFIWVLHHITMRFCHIYVVCACVHAGPPGDRYPPALFISHSLTLHFTGRSPTSTKSSYNPPSISPSSAFLCLYLSGQTCTIFFKWSSDIWNLLD